MIRRASTFGLGICIALLAQPGLRAQDWPQWLGPTRNAQAAGFQAPATWPATLKQDWKVTPGNGVSSPAVVGDRLYIYARAGSNEVLRCLKVADGEEIWSSVPYAVQAADGGASGFPGPRSSPAVANGKVVTLSLRGAVACLDAENGKLLWRKEEYNGKYPQFFTSSSPLIIGDLVVVQIGGERAGGVAAFELTSGTEKWKWADDGSAYSSPVLTTIDGAPVLIAETTGKIVGFNPATGAKLWETAYAVAGRGYNASTPIVAGDLLIYAGSNRGVKAVRLKKSGEAITAEEVWSNADNSVTYNTPVVTKGHLFGLSSNDVIFCINMETGKTAWTQQMQERPRLRAYGTLVVAGDSVLAMNPASQLHVFAASGEAYKELGSYKVAEDETFAVPVAVGKRIYVKSQESLVAWSVE